MARQAIPYDGYPADGARAVKIEFAGDYFGPANYQANGYAMAPSSIGMGRIETVNFSFRTQSENYFVAAFYPAISGANEQRAPGFNSVTIKWFSANGTEVANNSNLSAECAQMIAVGI